MIVITRDAEETLKATLDRVTDQSREQRILHMRFSQTDQPTEEWFDDICAALAEISDGHIGQVYLCDDRDMLVLMPHLTGKHLHKIMAFCARLFPEQDIEKLCSLHEVRIELARLRHLCIRKLEARHAKANEIDKRAQADERRTVLLARLSKVDPTLHATLQERRDTRPDVNILVIEDDALARMMIRNVLMADFHVQVIQDAQHALDNYLLDAPDVVFLDIGLPDISGQEILEQVMAIDPQAYVIMFSGRKDQDTVLKALNAGAMGFVGKPFTRGKLYQYIAQSPTVQRKKGRLRELQQDAY